MSAPTPRPHLRAVDTPKQTPTGSGRTVVTTERIADRYAADERGHYRVTRTESEGHDGQTVTREQRREIVSARVRITAAYADDTGEPYPISATEVADRLRPVITHYDLNVSRPDEGAVDLADVPAESFAKVEWPERAELAELPVMTAGGQSARHDITTAIRLSSPHPVIPAYGRLGWHHRGGRWLYVHGGGAWSADGAVPVRVHGDGLATFAMADPPADDAAGRRAFEALWGLFEMGPDRFAAVEIGAAFRAAMGRPVGSITYRAVNQSGKSGRMAFITQCWAPGVRWRNLPFNAGRAFATATYIEHVHHTFGDMLVPWDDMAPVGSPRERADYFDMFARSLFNGASKGRMGIQDRRIVARARLRPRAFGALSAEDLTAVESGQNRTHLLMLSREEFDPAAFEAADAGTGPADRSALMSAFVIWWAGRMPAYGYVSELEGEYRRALADATGAPGRYVESAADKAAGLHCGLAFAQERGWVSPERAADLWRRGWAGLCESLCAQVDANSGQSMADRIRDAILDGLAAREAHVLNAVDGTAPADSLSLGWDNERPHGRMIGWTEDGRLYLIPSSAAAFVSEYTLRAGSLIEVTSKAMGEALETSGYITGSEEHRDGRTVHRHTIAKKVQGRKKNVWVLRIPVDSGEDTTGPQDGPQTPAGPGSGTPICRGYSHGQPCGQPLMWDDGSGRHMACDPTPFGWPDGTLGADAAPAPMPTPAAPVAPPVPAAVTMSAVAAAGAIPAPAPAPESAARPAVRTARRVSRTIAQRVADALEAASGDAEAATAALVKGAIPDAIELLEEIRETGRYEFVAHPAEPEILRKRGRRANEIWEARPSWTNGTVPAGTEVARLDTNAAYLSALNTHLPIGALVHADGPEFNRRRSGLYLVTPAEWTRDDLPNPMGNRETSGPVWVTRPTVQLLFDVSTPKYGSLCAPPVIHESWTSGSTENMLRGFRDMLRDARSEAIASGDMITVEYVKPMYSKFVSTMIKESRFNHWIERSDWPHIIRAQAHGNLWRKALRARRAGLTVYRISGTDELHVIGDWRSVWTEGRALSEMKLKDMDNDGGMYRVGE